MSLGSNIFTELNNEIPVIVVKSSPLLLLSIAMKNKPLIVKILKIWFLAANHKS